MFNGPVPLIEELDSPEEEIQFVAEWLKERTEVGISPKEMGVFVRSEEGVGTCRSCNPKSRFILPIAQ